MKLRPSLPVFAAHTTRRPNRVLWGNRARLLAVLVVIGPITHVAAADSAADENQIPAEHVRFFEKEVRPLLAEHCWSCHGVDEQKGGLRLDIRAAAVAGGESGAAIVPGHADASLLMESVRYESYEMPPSGQLPQSKIDLLKRWIDLGAPWPGSEDSTWSPSTDESPFSDEDLQWWAVQPVGSPSVPEVDAASWPDNPIDNFVLSHLNREGLSPAARATKAEMIRRVSFDLIGLPPSADEVAAFVSDTSPDAYKRLVDRLLASRSYGERWARHWLDLVRYAESDGYRGDFYRPNAWRYRDYVIDSFNDDKPYDTFVREQLAADELFPDEPERQVALGYLWHGIYEWNSRDVVGQYDILLNDLTDTTADVFLGAGLQCARCHDHKFDPLLQEDYFRLRAFFEGASFEDDRIVARPGEITEFERKNAAWKEATSDIRAKLEAIERPAREKGRRAAIERFPLDIQAMIHKPEAERSPREQQYAELAWRQVDHEHGRLEKFLSSEEKAKRNELKKQLSKFDNLKPAPLPVARVAGDVGPVPPKTVIPKKRVEVEPGILSLLEASMHPEEANAVATNEPGATSSATETSGRRAELAAWITDPRNPFSTRVIVNRVWQYHFGKGLAPNGSDFGVLGGPPSHPELLDWLTRYFITNGWRLKPLHRLIVTSETYMQSTRHAQFDRHTKIDPTNRWYWRADTRRLDAEQVRDAILAVTGRLKPMTGGKSRSHDDNVRSVYLKVIRNKRQPLLDVFDLPQFFTSTSQRDKTTSPLQSLLLINSETVLGHAQALAKVAIKEAGSIAGDDAASFVVAAWRQSFGASPSPKQIDQGIRFLREQTAVLANETESPTTSSELDVDLAAFPTREGDAIRFERDAPAKLLVPHNEVLPKDSFTIEAFFQVDSIYSTGSVRTIASKWNGSRNTAGWAFGVTGKGSRRKPQTLVMHMFGNDASGKLTEAAVFSDQHIALGVPYYAAAAVTLGPNGGTVRFFLKDLSNDNESLNEVVREHRLVGGLSNDLPLAIGRRIDNPTGLFDGLIDALRLSSRPLAASETMFVDESVHSDTVGNWPLEKSLGVERDSSGNGLHLVAAERKAMEGTPEWNAKVDFSHILLNSNQFLYVY